MFEIVINCYKCLTLYKIQYPKTVVYWGKLRGEEKMLLGGGASSGDSTEARNSELFNDLNL